MNYSIHIEGMDEVIKGLNRMISETAEQKSQRLTEGAERTVQTMREEAPRATGNFRSTINYNREGADSVLIGPSDSAYGGRPVGITVSKGRAPGRTPPPWFAITARYGVDVASARRIAKKIGLEGTVGNPFVEKTFSLMQSVYDSLGLKAITNIANKF